MGASRELSELASLVSVSSGNVGIGTNSPLGRLHTSETNGINYFESPGISSIALQFRTNSVNRYRIGIPSASNDLAFYAGGTTETMRIDSSGNFLVGTTTLASSERLNVTKSTTDWVQRIYNSNASPKGLAVIYDSAAPNGTSNTFLYCQDSNAIRAEIRSNGGLANFSANNVNLSDERLKTDIQPAGSYLSKICAIPVKTFLYKDQTDSEPNLGVIAQDVEAVAPELVDASGFGETPEDGVPYKTIYQTDLQYALMKCIQEQQQMIETLQAKVAALEAR